MSTGLCIGVLIIAVTGFRRLRSFQCLNNPVAHLGSRLAGEGDGNDLFRRINDCKQAQVTPDQQLGLPGTGRRLDDKGQIRG